MTDVPRLALSDLITEYQLHRDRRHIYVEGLQDRAVLEWFLKSAEIDEVHVQEVDAIEISGEVLSRYKLTAGNKGRVLALALELDSSLSEEGPQVLCVVDADFDYILETFRKSRHLVYTDGTALEMYGYSAPVLERVLKLGFQTALISPYEVLNAVEPILRTVFVIRAANVSMKLGLEWLPFEKRCTIQADGKIRFDAKRFIRDYLSKNGEIKKEKGFCKIVDRLNRKASIMPPEQCIRSGDFKSLLARYLSVRVSGKSAKGWVKGDAVGKMLLIGVDFEVLLMMPLFQRIVSVFKAVRVESG